MTLALLMDEDSAGDLLVAIIRASGLDVVTVFDVGLDRTEDALVLDWAAANREWSSLPTSWTS